MENDDIPMPRPPDRLRALLAEALVRAGMKAAAVARLTGLIKDADRPEPEEANMRLYAVLLTDSRVSEKVCGVLKQSCGCTAVQAVGDTAWVVEAPDGSHKELRNRINDALEHHYSVFVFEIGTQFSGAYMPKDKCICELLSKY